MTVLDIGVDIDEPLYPWAKTAHALCVEAGITNGVDQPTEWNHSDSYGCDRDEWLRVLIRGTRSGELYDRPPIPGSVQALHRLRLAGHRIHLVTARGTYIDDAGQSARIRDLTVAWLHRFGVPHNSLTFSADKTIVRADVFIDDSVRNVAELRHAGVATAMLATPVNLARGEVAGWAVKSLSQFVDQVHSGRRLPWVGSVNA